MKKNPMYWEPSQVAKDYRVVWADGVKDFSTEKEAERFMNAVGGYLLIWGRNGTAKYA